MAICAHFPIYYFICVFFLFCSNVSLSFVIFFRFVFILFFFLCLDVFIFYLSVSNSVYCCIYAKHLQLPFPFIHWKMCLAFHLLMLPISFIPFDKKRSEAKREKIKKNKKKHQLRNLSHWIICFKCAFNICFPLVGMSAAARAIKNFYTDSIKTFINTDTDTHPHSYPFKYKI